MALLSHECWHDIHKGVSGADMVRSNHACCGAEARNSRSRLPEAGQITITTEELPVRHGKREAPPVRPDRVMASLQESPSTYVHEAPGPVQLRANQMAQLSIFVSHLLRVGFPYFLLVVFAVRSRPCCFLLGFLMPPAGGFAIEFCDSRHACRLAEPV